MNRLIFAICTGNLTFITPSCIKLEVAANVGGNLMWIGSAAGVELMGASCGQHTFLRYLR